MAAAEQAFRGVQPQIREATRDPKAAVPTAAAAGPRFATRISSRPFQLTSAALGTSAMRGAYRQPVLIAMTVVALVLLIACANIANLFLARAAARRHELSVRVALGAPRWRLARQLIVEILLLAGTGALAGLAIAQWISRLLVRQLSTQMTTVFLDVRLDWRLLAFTIAVTLATALLAGVAPALRASRADPIDAMRERGRGVTGDRRFGLSSALVIGQVALSLVLVAGAGLFMRTFTTLATLDHRLRSRSGARRLARHARQQRRARAARGAVRPRDRSGPRRAGRRGRGALQHHTGQRLRDRLRRRGRARPQAHRFQSPRRRPDCRATRRTARQITPGLFARLRHALRRRTRLHRAGRAGRPTRRHRQRNVRPPAALRAAAARSVSAFAARSRSPAGPIPGWRSSASLATPRIAACATNCRRRSMCRSRSAIDPDGEFPSSLRLSVRAAAGDASGAKRSRRGRAARAWRRRGDRPRRSGDQHHVHAAGAAD